jgi:hypothetical protein
MDCAELGRDLRAVNNYQMHPSHLHSPSLAWLLTGIIHSKKRTHSNSEPAEWTEKAKIAKQTHSAIDLTNKTDYAELDTGNFEAADEFPHKPRHADAPFHFRRGKLRMRGEQFRKD